MLPHIVFHFISFFFFIFMNIWNIQACSRCWNIMPDRFRQQCQNGIRIVSWPKIRILLRLCKRLRRRKNKLKYIRIKMILCCFCFSSITVLVYYFMYVFLFHYKSPYFHVCSIPITHYPTHSFVCFFMYILVSNGSYYFPHSDLVNET